MLTLQDIVADFARALKAVDTQAPVGSSRTRRYKPGVGPLTEVAAVGAALGHLRKFSREYEHASPATYPNSRQICDLLIPGAWAIEVKLVRPFGDNGRPAEHWAENILYPYSGTTSAIGDCYKLLESTFAEKKAVIVFGFEHTPPQLPLEPAIRSFELIAPQVCGIALGQRVSADFTDCIHPSHQQGYVYGWEVNGSIRGA
ncbi:MAG: hypothetical protein ACJ8AK_15815 [Gemmatimonadaceae bacterium]